METVQELTPDPNFRQMAHHAISPFRDIRLDPNFKIKVWDIEVPVNELWIDKNIKELLKSVMKGDFTADITGRMRVLVLCPKKPAPLDDIKFSVAWCSPFDMKSYRRDKANKIVAGRFVAAFNSGKNKPIRNTGIIAHVDTLKGFPSEVIKFMDQEVPEWVDIEAAIDWKFLNVDKEVLETEI